MPILRPRSRRRPPCLRAVVVSIVVAVTGALAACASSMDEARLRAREASREALRDYMVLQNAFFGDHEHYSAGVDSLDLPAADTAGLAVVWASPFGHGAIVRAAGVTPEMRCAVWAGAHDVFMEPVCDAPKPDTPLPPVRSGLLLGLRDLKGRYRTVWIGGDADSIALLARGPGLLVPRADGFWRVERSPDCPRIAAGPAGTWPAGARAHTWGWEGPLSDGCLNEDGDIEILQVGPEYLSLHQWGDARSGRAVDSWDDYRVVRLDSLAGRYALPVERFVPPSEMDRIEGLAKARGDALNRADSTDCEWYPQLEDVAVQHSRGRWSLAAYYAPSSPACIRFSIPIPDGAEPRLIGHDELIPGWAAVLAARPDAVDAVSSPSGDLLVVLTRDSLYTFHIEGGDGVRLAFVTAEPGSIVAAEWAQGSEVGRWTPQVRSFLDAAYRGGAPASRIDTIRKAEDEPGPAVPSGLLLGVGRGSYRTWWITVQDDSVELAASGPGLLVPRADGFWRVDAVPISDETVWVLAAPAERWAATVDSALQVFGPPDTDRCSEVWHQDRIQFVGRDYLSVSVDAGEGGCLWGGLSLWDRYEVRTLDATVPSAGDALGPATSRVLSDAFRTARDSVQASILSEFPDLGEFPYECHEGSWGIVRRPGRWEMRGELRPYRFSCQAVEVPLPVSLPPFLVSDGYVPVGIEEIRRVVPGVEDAVSSPRGDLLVALTADSLYVVRAEAGRLRRLAGSFPVWSGIVMAEWAFGSDVPRWTERVRALLEAGGDSR